ncbi:MAG: ACP S-malonyltransferase [Gammaproteobacteria bacterium]|nr:ACP S-malonyltransferase [Gammaproteobacteria bacterium]
MNKQLAIVFPGQGSQAVGMLAELAGAHPEVQATFAEASNVLGYDLWSLTQNGPEADLNQTDRTQPAMLAAGVAVWRVWCKQGGAQPAFMAGHSLGEYTALVCAGSLAFTDGIRLVAERGRRMQAAVPAGVGAMAAILGLEDAQVRLACTEAAQGDVVQAVNFNSPGQVVIAGHKSAVERACEQAKALGAKRAVPLAVSVPSHSSLMLPAAEAFAATLAAIEFKVPQIPVIHNADVAVHANPDNLRDALIRQIYNPVRWVETVQYLAMHGITRIVEAGPGKVLAGLNKRIDKNIASVAAFDSASLNEALADTRAAQ